MESRRTVDHSIGRWCPLSTMADRVGTDALKPAESLLRDLVGWDLVSTEVSARCANG
jgi:hypothetical protein